MYRSILDNTNILRSPGLFILACITASVVKCYFETVRLINVPYLENKTLQDIAVRYTNVSKVGIYDFLQL